MGEGKRHAVYGMCVFLVIGLVVGVIAGMAIYASAHPMLQSAEWAAWAQAVLTVAGIWAAWKGMNRQHLLQAEETSRRHDLEQADALEGVEGLSVALHGLAQGIRAVLLNEDPDADMSLNERLPAWRREVTVRANSLGSIPFHEIPYAYISVRLLQYMSEVNLYVDEIIELDRDEQEIKGMLFEQRKYIANEVFKDVGKSYCRYIDASRDKQMELRERAADRL